MELNNRSAVPLYKQLEHHLVGQIRNGLYMPDTPLPSITEIEKNCSAGRVTIVRAMRELVIDGYAVAVQGKGYFVTDRCKRPLVGIIAPFNSVYMQIYVHLAAGIRNEGDIKGADVITISTDEMPTVFKHSLNELVNFRGAKWIVAVPPMKKDMAACPDSIKEIVKFQNHNNVRFVIVDRNVDEGIFQIRQDRIKGKILLMERAVSKGLKKILFIDSPMADDVVDGRKNYEIITDESRKLSGGLSIAFRNSEGIDEDLGFVTSNKFDAVFTHDMHARNILNRLANVPPFALAGYNGMAVATSIFPRITTVSSNLAAAGKIAMDYFFSELSSAPRIVHLAPYLIEGDTF